MKSAQHRGDSVRGWAAASFENSTRMVFIRAVAAWQLVMIVAVAAEYDLGSARAPFIAASVSVLVIAFFVEIDRLPAWIFVLATDAVLLAGWIASESIEGMLGFACAWLGNFAYLLPVFVLRGRQTRLFSVVVLSVGPAGFFFGHRELVVEMSVSTLVTGTAVIWAAGRARRLLREFAGRVDAEMIVAAETRGAAAAARAHAWEAAERSRVLHDTVINTLGAVANGGGATNDIELVRDRCGRDVHTVQAVLDGHEVSAEVSDLEFVAIGLGLDVRRQGLDDEELSRYGQGLPDDVRKAFGAAARELIINVAKHSGERAVTLIVANDGGMLSITVADDGVGFDGQAVAGRGLAKSVLARTTAVGIVTTVDTSPGAGTRITLAYPLGSQSSFADPSAESEGGIQETVDAVRRQSGWWWAAAVLVVGIAIELANPARELIPASAMLAVMAVSWVVAWADVRRRGDMGPFATSLVVVSVPIVFVLSLASVDFARSGGIRWQAIAVTGPLVLLAEQTRSRRPFFLGCAVLAATAVATALIAAVDGTQARSIMGIGSVAALGVAGFWIVFQSHIARVGRVGADQHREAVAARLDRAATEAMARARESWPRAGLRGCLRLLTGLADGSMDPAAPAVRSACADEESYLRQLTALDPDLVHMQRWLALGLNRARSRGVVFAVRTGGVDVDAASAAAFGSLLERTIDAAPPGSNVTFSLFPTEGRLRLAIVGPSPSILGVARGWSVPAGWNLSVTTHETIDVIEVVTDLHDRHLVTSSSNVP